MSRALLLKVVDKKPDLATGHHMQGGVRVRTSHGALRENTMTLDLKSNRIQHRGVHEVVESSKMCGDEGVDCKWMLGLVMLWKNDWTGASA